MKSYCQDFLKDQANMGNNGRANLRLTKQINNKVNKYKGFDKGTQPTLLGKPKLITLADALCNQKP